MKPFFRFFFSFLIALGLTVSYISHHLSLSEYQSVNLEALAASETYELGECRFGTHFGDNMVYDYFCIDFTSDYTIYDCEFSFRSPMSFYGKCVQLVY